MKDFLAAIQTRGKPVADIEQGYISTAACILANLSMKLGRSLTWDAEKGRIVNDDEANKLLKAALPARRGCIRQRGMSERFAECTGSSLARPSLSS